MYIIIFIQDALIVMGAITMVITTTGFTQKLNLWLKKPQKTTEQMLGRYS